MSSPTTSFSAATRPSSLTKRYPFQRTLAQLAAVGVMVTLGACSSPTPATVVETSSAAPIAFADPAPTASSSPSPTGPSAAEASASAEASRLAAEAAASASAEASRLAAEEQAAAEAQRQAEEQAAAEAQRQAEEQAAAEAQRQAEEQAAPAPAPQQNAYYANCSEARAAGVDPLYVGDPGYRSELDRDNDGIACE